MRYPAVFINLKKIQKNAEYLKKLCENAGAEMMAITKGVCSYEPVVEAILEAGIKKLGDARIRNIKKMRAANIKVPIYLIRIPMLSEIEDVVAYTDGSLNSELAIIKALSHKAKTAGKTHKIILMVDVGDLREGVLPKDVLDMVGEILKLPNIEFEGLGTNIGCYGGVIPSFENTKILVDLKRTINNRYKIKIKTVSGGTTATLPLIEKGQLPSGINQFRIGEAILLGTDGVNNIKVGGTFQDTILLKTEVIELKIKPENSNTKRAIVALGKQDCRIEGLTPLDNSIEILGASSDHLILDVTEKDDISVGTIIEFRLNYGAMLSLMTSEYVYKQIL